MCTQTSIQKRFEKLQKVDHVFVGDSSVTPGIEIRFKDSVFITFPPTLSLAWVIFEGAHVSTSVGS